MVSVRAEREQATALLRRARWRLGIVIGVVLLAIAGLLALAGGSRFRRGARRTARAPPTRWRQPSRCWSGTRSKPVACDSIARRWCGWGTRRRSPGRRPSRRGGRWRPGTHRSGARLRRRPSTAAPAAAYNYRQHAVYLRQGQPVNAPTRVALVYALTLALQDQNTDLATLRRQAADDPDQARALTALVEGDATRIERAYLASLPAADQTAARAERDYSPSPTSYGQLVAAFPATAGQDFATALAEQGGNQAVDAAFRRPPASTAQIIDPKAYQGGAEPLGVRPPPGEGQRVDAGTLGQFGLAALITGGRRATNAGAAGCWLGDSYGTSAPATACARTSTSCWRTPSRGEQLVRDLGRFVIARGGREAVTRGAERGVRLRSCA